MRRNSSTFNLCNTFDRDNTFLLPSSRYIDKILVSRTMVNHIRRVEKIKSTIDNTIPKSFLATQNRRSSAQSETFIKNQFNLKSMDSLNSEHFESESQLSSDCYYLKINRNDMKQILRQKRLSSNLYALPLSAKTTETSGDVIERFPNSFVEEKPFHPRIKKTSITSKLASNKKCYCPLKSTSSKSRDISIPNSQNETKNRNMSVPASEKEIKPEKDSTTFKIKEQKCDLEATSSTYSTIDHMSELGNDDECSYNRKKEPNAEEYSEFLVDVSDEILSTGIFTNKAISEICQKHIKSNEKRLSLTIMNERLSVLKDKLGILDQKKLCQVQESSSESTQNDNSLTNDSSQSNNSETLPIWRKEPNLRARNKRRTSELNV